MYVSPTFSSAPFILCPPYWFPLFYLTFCVKKANIEISSPSDFVRIFTPSSCIYTFYNSSLFSEFYLSSSDGFHSTSSSKKNGGGE